MLQGLARIISIAYTGGIAMIEIKLTLDEAELINDLIVVNAGLYDDQTRRRLGWVSMTLRNYINKERMGRK